MARYWVGGTGTWNGTNTTNWSDSDGGAGGQSVPTSADNVFFTDKSSTSNAAYTVTVAVVTGKANNLTINGPGGGNKVTLATNFSVDIYGSLSLAGGAAEITLAGTIVPSFLSTSTGNTIFTNGVTITGTTTFNGSGGGWTLSDDFTSSGQITFTTGSLSLGGNDLSCSLFVAASGTAARTLDWGGSGVLTVSGAGGFDVSPTASNFTLVCSTGTLKHTYASTTAMTPTLSDHAYYNLEFAHGAGTGDIRITGTAWSCNQLKVTSSAAFLFRFQDTSAITIADWQISGSAGNLITIGSSSTTGYTLTKTGGVVSADYLTVQRMTGQPDLTWYMGANSSGTNTSQVYFTAAPTTTGSAFLLNFI
jgi:hypothetical protein